MNKIDKEDINYINSYKLKLIPFGILVSGFSTYIFYKINNFINKINVDHLKSKSKEITNMNRNLFFKKFKFLIFGTNFLISYVFIEMNYRKRTEELYEKYKYIVDEFNLQKINKEKFDNYKIQ